MSNEGKGVVQERRRSARIVKLNDDQALRINEQQSTAQPQQLLKKRRVHAGKKPVTEVHPIRRNVISASVPVNPKYLTNVSELKFTVKSDGASTSTAPPPEEKSAHQLVLETLRTFNKHYLHFVKEEDKRTNRAEKQAAKQSNKRSTDSKEEDKRANRAEKQAEKLSNKRSKPSDSKTVQPETNSQNDIKRTSNRPDLKALSKMQKDGEILQLNDGFGSVPGIDVGHQFFSRAEMVILGFHNHWLNGIDYIGSSAGKKHKDLTLPVTRCIVLSGQYEDDLDNCESITYTGQGGNNLLGNKRQVKDQKLARGNLGLKNCMEQGVPVRVVRGHDCPSSYVKKVYTYDGLYKVDKYWAETGVSGFTVYKYSLTRLEGQPELTTNQVHFARGSVPESVSTLRGLVLDDITGGQEKNPIPASNLVNNPPLPPTGFTYCHNIQVAANVKMPENAKGCNCIGECTDPRTCSCAQLNGSDFPYVKKHGGRLVEATAVVFECGPNCRCSAGCVNRTSQRGLSYRLEVFKTPKKGWAVRSWDYIPSGAPVCEYVGVLKKTEDLDASSDNNYIFDIDCIQTMKGLDGREKRLRDVSLASEMMKSDDHKSDSQPEFCIDAGSVGNVARFINHSCEPNLFVQCVLSTHHDIKMARIVLFAADNIPPLKELTYDYGYALDSVVGPDGEVKKLPCHCGAEKCRKRLH